MNRVVLRIIALVVVLAVLAYGLFVESHQIRGFLGKDSRSLPGMALREAPVTAPWWPSGFCEGAAVDAFVLRDNGLYNVQTLSAGQASIKDCKT
jgi:hypothetical protein